jgi:hypothetical protein
MMWTYTGEYINVMCICIYFYVAVEREREREGERESERHVNIGFITAPTKPPPLLAALTKYV